MSQSWSDKLARKMVCYCGSHEGVKILRGSPCCKRCAEIESVYYSYDQGVNKMAPAQVGAFAKYTSTYRVAK